VVTTRNKREKLNVVIWKEAFPWVILAKCNLASELPEACLPQVFSFPELVRLHCLMGHAAPAHSLDINKTEE